MDERFLLIKNTIFTKITTILLCGILCAGLLVAEKAFFTKFSIQVGGEVMAEYIFSVANPVDKPDPKKKLNYPWMMHSNPNLARFIKIMEGRKFDFSKLEPNWNKLSDLEKMNWLKRHISVQYLQGNNGKIRFYLRQREVLDLAYLKKNCQVLLDAFIQAAAESCRKVNPNASIKVSGKHFAFPKEIPLSRNDILLKYGLIGFILGCLLRILIVLVPVLRKQDHV